MKLKLPVRIASHLLSLMVFSFVLLLPIPQAVAQTVTSNTQNTHNGFFYSFWNDGSQGSASMTLGAAGNYSTTWNNIGNFTAGKGWAVGKPDRVVCFSGNFNGGSNGFLALYGWTKNALIEYYVCENHGAWTPPGNTSDIVKKGTYTSDGGTYTIYTATRTNQPSIIGNATFKQYWSVRTETRSTGTITFANHVAAWKNAGMDMGTTWDYQIMESEGYHSSGSSNITVSECVSCTTPAPAVAVTSFDYEVGATATQLAASGTAVKWYTVATGGTALTSAPTPATGTAGTTTYYAGQTLNGCEGPRVEVTIRVSQKYKIYKVPAPIVVDGTIDATWLNASVLPASAARLLSGAVTNSADLSGNFKALWDDTYLYVLADVTDDKLVNESTNVYDDDGVEVYVDINNDKAAAYGANDVQYTFGWNDGTKVGVLPAGRSTTGITYAAVARTGGYIVEARIPWSAVQGTPVAGQLVGMDFMINDDDDTGARDGKLSWNASADDAWENPSLFGTAVLQGVLPCTTPAEPTVTSPVIYCQNETAAALTATGNGLLWYTTATGGTGTSTATPLTKTVGNVTYYVTQNSGGCESARTPVTVTVNALPAAAITAGSATTFCTGGSVTLTASTGVSYVWRNGSTQVSTAAAYAASAAGSYTVEVMNADNCKAVSAPAVVTVNTPPAAPAVNAAITYCQDAAAAALTANGNALKWYDVANGGTALANAPVPSTAASGTKNYYVSQTASGCESPRALITVTVNALPAAAITAGSATTFCTGGSVTLTASTGASYVWRNGSTQISTAAAYAASAAGSYTVEVMNADNCKAVSAPAVVTVNTPPAAPSVNAAITYCQDAPAAALTANGNALKWYDVANGGTALANAPVPSTAASGTKNYYVSQTASGCESPRALITVTVNALPAAAITAGSATTFCTGGSVTLTASTGVSYVWRNGSTQVSTAAAYAASAAGSYTVEVMNADNCKAVSVPAVVTVNTPPAAPSVNAAITYCQDAAAAALTANGNALKWYDVANGGTALANAPVPSTAASGTKNYYVSQTASGCESPRALITVTVNPAPAATITVDGSTTIIDGQTVTLHANTGTDLTYAWYHGNTKVGTDASYTTNVAGNYTVEVTNASDCKNVSAVTSVSTTDNQPSVINIISLEDHATVQSPVTITATVSDPDGAIVLVEFLDGLTVIGSTASEPYTFTWTDAADGEHEISVRATDVFGGVTTSSSVTVNTTTITTGVKASGSNVNGNVYPVPARDQLIVETDLDLSDALFRITDAVGEEVSVPVSIDGHNATLNVSGLSEGAYILVVRQKSNILTKKIILVR